MKLKESINSRQRFIKQESTGVLMYHSRSPIFLLLRKDALILKEK